MTYPDSPAVLILGIDAYVRVPAEFAPDRDDECGTVLDWYPGWIQDDGEDPLIHAAPDVPLEGCPVCAPLLSPAVAADAADERFAA